MKYLKIPIERVGVLIGHNGEIKKDLEAKSGVKLIIDSKLGEVVIDDHKGEDPLMVIKIENIVKAISRGFSPEHAMRLLDDDADFYVFDIHDYVRKKESHVRRLKSRVIGRKGKTKRVLEELTDSNIAVYGHTVSVIAAITSMDVIKKAMDMLLSGSRHANVYRFVESSMRKLKMEERFGL